MSRAWPERTASRGGNRGRGDRGSDRAQHVPLACVWDPLRGGVQWIVPWQGNLPRGVSPGGAGGRRRGDAPKAARGLRPREAGHRPQRRPLAAFRSDAGGRRHPRLSGLRRQGKGPLSPALTGPCGWPGLSRPVTARQTRRSRARPRRRRCRRPRPSCTQCLGEPTDANLEYSLRPINPRAFPEMVTCAFFDKYHMCSRDYWKLVCERLLRLWQNRPASFRDPRPRNILRKDEAIGNVGIRALRPHGVEGPPVEDLSDEAPSIVV